MAASHQVDCEVRVSPEQEMGIYSNALRVTDQDKGRCLLEFLVYSETLNKARVVLQVSVPKAFIPVIRNEIDRRLGKVIIS